MMLAVMVLQGAWRGGKRPPGAPQAFCRTLTKLASNADRHPHMAGKRHAAAQRSLTGGPGMAELLKNKSILMLLAGFALLIVIGIITS